MSPHGVFQKALMGVFVLSMTSIASAHNFPKPMSSAEIAAERAAACKAAARPAKRTFARFGPASNYKAGAPYRVVGAHRFGGERYAPAVACTRQTRGTIACL